MNILISGGTGLIGGALSKELLSHGHSVFILSRSRDLVTNPNENIQVLTWDGKRVTGWADVLDQIDAVVNLAGAPLNGNGPLDIWLTKKRKKKLINSRLDSTNALVEGIQRAKNKPKVFVQASAVGYYGARGDEWIDETHPSGNDFLAQVQVSSEQSTDILESMGIRRVIIRTGLVFAKQDSSLEYFKLQFSLFAGGRMGSGNQYYSWIHLQDEVDAIRFLLMHDHASGVFNLCSPNPERNKDFSKILGKVMQRPSFFVIPGFLLKMILGEISNVVLDGQRVSTKKLESIGYTFKYPNLIDALEDVIK
jgi:uncharacterized protein (TIGR01777 family)